MSLTAIISKCDEAPHLVASVIGAVLGFAGGDLMTSNVGLATAAGIICAPLAALFATWPKVLQARTEARRTDAQITAQKINEMFNRQQEANIEQQHELKQTIERNARERALMRHTKHILGNELSAALLHIQLMEFRMHEAKMDFEPFKRMSFHEIYKDEDEGLLTLSQTSPPTKKETDYD